MTDDLKARLSELTGTYGVGDEAAYRIADLEAEIARLTAERDAAMAGAVKVKPLVWKEEARNGWKIGVSHAVGFHLIRRDDGWHYGNHSGGVFASLEDAKAAAQADYEARIRAALQPDPDARQADLAKAASAVMHDIDDLVANSEGVSGLHLNGDVAPWSEIMDGGAYEAWMQSVERLREAIRVLPPPADLAAKIGGE